MRPSTPIRARQGAAHAAVNRRSAAGLVAAALAAVLGTADTADAQLTTKALVGDSVSEPDSPRYTSVNEAIERFNNRDVLGARQFLETAKRQDPKLPPVGVMLAKMYGLTKNGAAVRPALEQSINDEADDPEPYLLLAESTLQANQTIEADALFDKSVRLIDGYDANAKRKRRLTIRAYRGRAAVAERRRNWDAAEADLRVWLEQDPDSAVARTRLGNVLCMLDRVEDGRKEFEAAKKLDDQRPSPFVMVANAYERKGQQAEALAEFKKAYAEPANKTDETTLLTYAQALVRAGDLSTAGSVLQAARQTSPGSFNVWLLSGVAYRMAGQPDQAERAFMQALSLQPNSRDVFDQLSLVLVSQDDKAKKARGLQFAATNAKLYPNNADVLATLAWSYFENGRGSEATAALRKALQTGGGAFGADARVSVAKILVEAGQTENARRLLTSALGESAGIFVQRADAEKLLESLK